MSFGEYCNVGDRVSVVIDLGAGDKLDKGLGTVTKIREGVNRQVTVNHDNGQEGTYNWKHIREADE